MSRFGRLLRERRALLHALIAVLILPLLLAFVVGASSARTMAAIFLALGLSVLIRAYRAGDGQ